MTEKRTHHPPIKTERPLHFQAIEAEPPKRERYIVRADGTYPTRYRVWDVHLRAIVQSYYGQKAAAEHAAVLNLTVPPPFSERALRRLAAWKLALKLLVALRLNRPRLERD